MIIMDGSDGEIGLIAIAHVNMNTVMGQLPSPVIAYVMKVFVNINL